MSTTNKAGNVVSTQASTISTGPTQARKRQGHDQHSGEGPEIKGVAAGGSQIPSTSKPAGKRHRQDRGGVCTCRNVIALFLVAGSLLTFAGLVTLFWFAYRSATASDLAFDKRDPAAGYPVRAYHDARPGGFDVFARVWWTEAEPGVSDIFAGRIMHQTTFQDPVSANFSLSLKALGPLDPFGMPPISARLAIVPTPHQYTFGDLSDLEPDLGNWATEGLLPPVYLRDFDLVRYLWRPVNAPLPIARSDDTANTEHPSSPHLILRVPMHFVTESAVYDGAKMEKKRAQKAAEQKVCDKLAFSRDKKDCVQLHPHDALSRLAGGSEQPFDRMVNLNKLTIGDGGNTTGSDEKVYLPLFIFPFWTLLPADLLPLQADKGIPVGAGKVIGATADASYVYNVTFTASQISRVRGALSSAIAAFSEHEDEHAPASQFTAFPPRFPNATYSPSSVVPYHGAWGVANHVIATSPLIASSLFAAGMPFIGVPRIVYWLTRRTAVGISRAAVETELAWAGCCALRQAAAFVSGLSRPQGIFGWLFLISSLAFAGWSWVVKLLVGGTLQNSLLTGLLGVSVTRNLRVRWSRCLPRIRADGLSDEEIRSAREEGVPWVHRIALLATLAAVYPLFANTWPTSLAAALALYKQPSMFVPVGTIAACILQLRLNGKRKTFAGNYKLVPILSLAAQASETALRLLWRRPAIPWAVVLDAWWSVQAIMYRGQLNKDAEIEE
ncbi:hypothetical protein HDU89_006743 [Geranomyces variabilis]|nr:hypothetical protein HDU89_006743 [Geranomyces variabilis]